ncbi:aromatic acid/H+ symport family MFS transporter [Neisseria sp. ZJ106]|uniref:Aromatic acid/H+ symport family MFS transporter n=1 Tax=Neisseria lisongii TaxID=2912188 RepID=A0ABY7RL25_9NEIS|nr:aromatic acid/H+ symport family MFS transporter [Neisseria lisongii]MCF7521098.1 aromatic acid/H+ symport family MFS transporter [Neisseria lisongii]WCL72023.1 aromatic acid/H+ symport family MFS transporter [Neisseria lisongii]
MSQQHEINVRELLDSRSVSTYQKLVIFLCFLIVVMDGFDVVIMGFVGPSLKEAWQLSNNDLAPVLSAALFGLTFGALAAGPLGDRFGRRKILIASVLTFGTFTLLVAFASQIWHMIAFRFIAGFAMGGIMPMVATLAKEYSPERRSALLVTIVFAGFTVGAAGGGFLAAWMIPQFGWPSVFYFGGIIPILLSIFMVFKLPESLAFMVHKGGDRTQIRKIVEWCAPGSTTEHSTFTIPAAVTVKNTGENPIKTVLSTHYRGGTLLLWAIYFSHLFLVYLLGSWMPTMIKESGMTAAQASIISAMFQLGGPLGSIMLGWFMDRFEPHRVLALSYLSGAVVLVFMSSLGPEYMLLCLTSFYIGAAFNGGGTGMNALSSNFFPLSARATGNSWMHGIGRTGAILSAFAGAWMLNAGWNFSTVATALTVPALIIAACLTAKYFLYRNKAEASV